MTPLEYAILTIAILFALTIVLLCVIICLAYRHAQFEIRSRADLREACAVAWRSGEQGWVKLNHPDVAMVLTMAEGISKLKVILHQTGKAS